MIAFPMLKLLMAVPSLGLYNQLFSSWFFLFFAFFASTSFWYICRRSSRDRHVQEMEDSRSLSVAVARARLPRCFPMALDNALAGNRERASTRHSG